MHNKLRAHKFTDVYALILGTLKGVLEKIDYFRTRFSLT
jgi:hypothetical protein